MTAHATPPRRQSRDEILARVDLATLADELLGHGRTRGAQRTWPCPTHQPQTGATPPVTIFTAARGTQRWHCHACGAGGTAIDLLIQAQGLDVRQALDTLAERPTGGPGRPHSMPAPPPPRRDQPPAHDVLDHVHRCAELLWSDHGAPVRHWLAARGFTERTLRTQSIGADPGPRILRRAHGLPSAGMAATFPARNRAGDIVYFQARYLDPDRAHGRKYDNPVAALATNPRLAYLAAPADPGGSTVFVCEGLADALSVAQAGHTAVAVLGAGLAGPQIADRLVRDLPTSPLRLAFDADPRGTAAADQLLDELIDREHTDVATLRLPSGVQDLNDWLISDAGGLTRSLTDRAMPVPISLTCEPPALA